jgi:small subunit ribosomal protein S13
MIYIFESEINDNKPIIFSLQGIYGIGKNNSRNLCKMLGLSNNIKIKNLSKDQINKILKTLGNLDLKLGSDLKKLKSLNLKNLINIKSYKGLRRYQGLPVRGQRTHTNANTSKRIR